MKPGIIILLLLIGVGIFVLVKFAGKTTATQYDTEETTHTTSGLTALLGTSGAGTALAVLLGKKA